MLEKKCDFLVKCKQDYNLDINIKNKNIYDENFSLKYEIPFFREGEKGGELKDIGPKEILDSFAVVGAAGVITDMLAAEDPLRAVEFTLTPVIWQDLNKIYDTVYKFSSEAFTPGDYGIFGATRRLPKTISPVFNLSILYHVRKGM